MHIIAGRPSANSRKKVPRYAKKKPRVGGALNGGRDRDRTDDLLVANEALSQLSYTPDKSVFYGVSVTGTYLL